MVEPTECSRIAPCPDADWKATVTAFHVYLAQCLEALAASRQVYEDAIGHIDTDTTKERTRPTATGRGLGLPKDAATHRSEFVYLLPAGGTRELMEGIPASTGYRPSLWTVLEDEIPTAKRKPKAA